MTEKIYSFDPVAGKDARILILGTLPSAASLEAGYNYAHPKNAFWYIIQALLMNDESVIRERLTSGDISDLIEITPEKLLPIEKRKQILIDNKIALWDSLHSATRPGSSLDSAIDLSTETANDIPGFLLTHTKIRAIFFNGTKSESVFKKYIEPRIAAEKNLSVECANRPVVFRRLPSTSPANAGISLKDKLTSWSEILDYL